MVLVGSYTSENCIYKLEVSNDGHIGTDCSYPSGENPSYLIKTDNNIVSVNEIPDESNLSLFNINLSELKLKKSYKSGGVGPCHLLEVKEGFILCSNYDNGSLSLLGTEGGRISLCDNILHTGCSINVERQEASHIHSTAYHKAYDIIYCVDLGTDKIVSYRINSDKKLQKLDSVSLTPGDGPRLMIIDESIDTGFVVNELSNTVASFDLNVNGSLKCTGRFSTLPEGYRRESYASHIELSRCREYLLISNRGHDSIVVFKLDGNKLGSPEWYSTIGQWPRHFAFYNDLILVANQNSNSINSFRFDKGKIIDTGYCLSIEKPTMILAV